MKRPKTTDKECRRQGMTDVPVANYSKMQDKYIDYLEAQAKQLILSGVSQQRELLNTFRDWTTENLDSEDIVTQEAVDSYLESL